MPATTPASTTATDKSDPTNGPIASCQLPAAAFTNVGLAVPRFDGLAPSLGKVNVPVLFVDFSDAPATLTPEEAFDLVDPVSTQFFDAMSYGRMDIGGPAPEFFAFERWMLGWIDDSQIVCHLDGQTNVELTPIETAGGPKAVIVPTGQTSAMVVESRRKTGYDADMDEEGVLIYVVDSSIESGFGPIVVLPDVPADRRRTQALLGVGESLTHNGIMVSVTDSTTSGDTVSVTK